MILVLGLSEIYKEELYTGLAIGSDRRKGWEAQPSDFSQSLSIFKRSNSACFDIEHLAELRSLPIRTHSLSSCS